MPTFFRLVPFCGQQHRNIPRLRRPAPEPFLEIHPTMASSLSIEEGEWALFETVMGRVKLNPSLHPKVVSTQYGWWQECQQLGLPAYDALGPGGANVNLLFSNDAFDPISGSVAHRSLMCRVRKETVLVQDCAI